MDDIETEYLTRRTAEGYRTCLSYEGYHEYGFHLFTVYPRLFLEFINDNDEKILTLSHEEYMAALEQFMW